MLAKIQGYLELIKFSHSVFALPFALTGLILAARLGLGEGQTLMETGLWVIVAMVGARSGAMGFNRWVDRRYDAANPRTANRPSVTGEVKESTMLGMTLLSYGVLVFAAWRLNEMALYLSPVAILLVSFYSLTKRFTSFCHVFLGLAIGAAPIAAWVAARGEISPTSLLLGGSVLLWITGFDILYALQDLDYDKGAGLHSIPVALGVKGSLALARLFHLGAVVCWVLLASWESLSWIYGLGVALSAALLLYEHSLLRGGDLSKLDLAFFNMNAYISMTLFFAVLLDLTLLG